MRAFSLSQENEPLRGRGEAIFGEGKSLTSTTIHPEAVKSGLGTIN